MSVYLWLVIDSFIASIPFAGQELVFYVMAAFGDYSMALGVFLATLATTAGFLLSYGVGRWAWQLHRWKPLQSHKERWEKIPGFLIATCLDCY